MTQLKQNQTAIETRMKVFDILQTEGIVIVDQSGIIIDLNEAFARMVGYDRHVLISKIAFQLWNSLHYEELRSQLENDEPEDFYYTLVSKDGDMVYVKSTVKSLYYANKNCRVFIMQLDNSNRRKEAHPNLLYKHLELAEGHVLLEDISNFVELTPALIFLTNINGNLLYSNPATENIFGYSKDQIMTWNIMKDFHRIYEGDHERVNSLLTDMYKNKPEHANFNARYFNVDGRLIWLNWHLNFDWENNLLYVIGHDISEVKEISLQLEFERNKLLEAQKIAHLGNWEYDLITKQLYWSNEMYCIFDLQDKHYQQTLEAFLDLLHSEDRHIVEEIILQKPTFGVSDIEVRMKRRNGEMIWVHSISRYEYDTNGTALRAVGTIQDVTQQKIMSDEIMENEIRFRAVFENLNSPMLLSQNGKLLLVNEALLRNYGYDQREDLLGKSELSLFTPECYNRIMDYTNRRIDGSYAPIKYEATALTKDGSTFEVEVYVSVYKLSGILYTVASLIDISSHKKAEAYLQQARDKADAANMLKSEFLNNMTHELRTPLNGIIGPAELMQYACKDEEQLEYISMIKESAFHLLKLIDDLLDIARMDQDKHELHLDQVNIKELLTELSRDYAKQAANKELDFIAELDEALPDSIICDGSKIRQVLQNLLSNAVKFTDKGSIKFGTTCLTNENDMVTLSFQVSDTGIGIEHDALRRLFGHYDRMKDPFMKTIKGSGFGIEICKKLANLLGGELTVQSVPGGGSTFQFVLNCPSIPNE